MQAPACATNSSSITFTAVTITAPAVTHNAPCFHCDAAVALSLYICTSLTTIQHQQRVRQVCECVNGTTMQVLRSSVLKLTSVHSYSAKHSLATVLRIHLAATVT
eukprot:4405-Heterococcus_DN1.PRE.4